MALIEKNLHSRSVIEPDVESVAFQQALLRSERLRILIVLGAISVAPSIRTIRTLILHSREEFELWTLASLLLILLVIYETPILRATNGAIRKQQDLTGVVWISSVILETSLPGFALALLPSSSVEAE